MASPLDKFKQEFAKQVAGSLGLPDSEIPSIYGQVRVPEREHGDLSISFFQLGKQLSRPPLELAAQAAKKVPNSTPVGPHLNATIDRTRLASEIIPAARNADFGDSQDGEGRTVVIDFSSPNIAKPLAFHHIRSTVIGAAVGRLHRSQGWRVVGINYLGDWGKQFGLLATGFRRYGDPAKRADAKHLIEVYVKANQDADVEGLRAKMNGPSELRALVTELETARQLEKTAADDKETKKREKKTKQLEKKLRGLRGLTDDSDPLEGLLEFIEEKDAEAERATSALPAAEAKDQEARLFFKKLEEKDPVALAEWREFRETSIAEFQRVYRRMGIEFTAIEGESFYTDVLEATVARVSEKPGTERDQGALIAKLEQKPGEPPVLLQTKDGTTLYITRDIAAAIDRHERFQFNRALYVVAQDQALHFQQLFRLLGAMGFDFAKDMQHVAFGRVHGMSTRRGSVIFLDEVLDESVAKAREICEASDRIDRAHLDETVEAIGIGAVVFGDLKNLRTSDYTFKWEEVLNFEGFTGPYVQFSHARACSILEKGGGAPGSADLSLLALPEERDLILALAAFPGAVKDACEAFEPSYVTRALLEVAQRTASYFTAGNREREKRILVDGNPALQAARLQLVDAVRCTLAKGLSLLGVAAPKAM